MDAEIFKRSRDRVEEGTWKEGTEKPVPHSGEPFIETNGLVYPFLLILLYLISSFFLLFLFHSFRTRSQMLSSSSQGLSTSSSFSFLHLSLLLLSLLPLLLLLVPLRFPLLLYSFLSSRNPSRLLILRQRTLKAQPKALFK